MTLRLTALCAAALAALAIASLAEVSHAATPDAALREYLRRTLGPAPAAPDTCVAVAWQDLNGDGRPEALVYVSGPGWCGSGGCNLRILEQGRAGFRPRGSLTVTRPPIGVLDTRTRGWRDLAVSVGGGGINPGYVAAVPFNGSRYAGNPTTRPARRVTMSNFLIPADANGEALFDAAMP